jgi:hypothetical protein
MISLILISIPPLEFSLLLCEKDHKNSHSIAITGEISYPYKSNYSHQKGQGKKANKESNRHPRKSYPNL